MLCRFLSDLFDVNCISNLHGIPDAFVGYVLDISTDVAPGVFPALEEVVADERKNIKWLITVCS